jgi:hypothetical protein
MTILPNRWQQHFNRADRNQSLMFGVLAAISAFFCIYNVLTTLVVVAVTHDFSFGLWVFQILAWGAIGALAVVVATGYLTRYFTPPTPETNESNRS